MEKYTALLIPAYLSGFVLAVLLVSMLTPASGTDDSFFYFPMPIGLVFFIIGGALTGIMTILLARGISYLFLDQSQ